MNEAPRQQSPEVEAVKYEIREEHGNAVDVTSVIPPEEQHVDPDELEKDPARNPENDALKNAKGA